MHSGTYMYIPVLRAHSRKITPIVIPNFWHIHCNSTWIALAHTTLIATSEINNIASIINSEKKVQRPQLSGRSIAELHMEENDGYRCLCEVRDCPQSPITSLVKTQPWCHYYKPSKHFLQKKVGHSSRGSVATFKTYKSTWLNISDNELVLASHMSEEGVRRNCAVWFRYSVIFGYVKITRLMGVTATENVCARFVWKDWKSGAFTPAIQCELRTTYSALNRPPIM